MGKPGYKTSEFWLALAALMLSSLMLSGALGEGSRVESVVALAVNTLATLGYTGARLVVKRGELASSAAAPKKKVGK